MRVKDLGLLVGVKVYRREVSSYEILGGGCFCFFVFCLFVFYLASSSCQKKLAYFLISWDSWHTQQCKFELQTPCGHCWLCTFLEVTITNSTTGTIITSLEVSFTSSRCFPGHLSLVLQPFKLNLGNLSSCRKCPIIS